MYSLYTLCGHRLIAGTLQLICIFCVYLILARKSNVREDIVFYMEDHKITSAGIFALCLLISLFSNPNFYRFVGCEDIRTMPGGEYCYYVEVNREPDDRAYTLPAKVIVSKNEYTSTNSDGEERTEHETGYRLAQVYFSNGGYLRVSDEVFDVDKPFSFIDQDGDYWDCIFTNTRCDDAPFRESNDTPVKYTILLTFEVLILVLAYISLLRDAKEDEAEYNRMMALRDLEKANDPVPARKIENESRAATAPIDPPPQKPAAPFVADAGRGNSIWPILAAVLGGIVLALIVAVVIIACD